MKNRIKILLLIIVIVATTINIGTIPVSAATNTVNSFKQGQLVKCGKYLFASALSKEGTSYKLIRTKSNGTSAKRISSSLNNNTLCTYKKSVFYQTNNGIYSYSVSSGKSKKICSSVYRMEGICSAGLVCKKSDNIYLVKFNKSIKKILNGDNSYCTNYLGASKRYVYSTKVSYISSPVFVWIYRYDVKTGKTKKTATISTYAGSNNLSAADFHTFKNYVVFSLGYYEGSMNNYVGELYRMKTNGTGVKKIVSSNKVGETLTPGKNCVYVNIATNSFNSSFALFEINSSGQASKVKKSSVVVVTTSNDKAIFASKGSVYVRGVSASKGRCVIPKSKIIKSSYPSDSESRPEIIGEYGNMALVNCAVFSYQNGGGWRGDCVARTAYLINTQTYKSYKIG